MKIKPVDTVPVPGYPDKYAKETRKVVAMTRPRRWSGAPLAVGILSAAMAIGLSGCTEGKLPKGSVEPLPPPFSSAVVSEGLPGELGGITMGEPISVPIDSFIPLFEYGEGTGSIGCVSIAAPVFMSEEEAQAILSAAFAEAGLEVDWSPSTIEDAIIPVANFSMENNKSIKIKRGDLDIDGMLGLHESLPIEFVSVNDLDEWHEETGVESSVLVYDVRQTAQKLADGNPGLIVFYDPVSKPDFDKFRSFERKDGESDEDYYSRYDALLEEETKVASAKSEQLLREQANALIEWLRGEGVI